jgi:arylsulfatase
LRSGGSGSAFFARQFRRPERDATPVEPKKTPEEGYHFMEDMTNKAIAWIAQQKALASDKPVFVYFAPGATHAHHYASWFFPRGHRTAVRYRWLRAPDLNLPRMLWP